MIDRKKPKKTQLCVFYYYYLCYVYLCVKMERILPPLPKEETYARPNGGDSTAGEEKFRCPPRKL